jgi:Carboxypeptidase regulatory-like domain
MRSAYVWAAAGTAILVATSATSLRGVTAVGSITVMVRAGNGTNAPVGGAMVTIVGTQTGAMTTTQGKAHIGGLSPGLHSVAVRRIGFCATTRPVTVIDGADVQLTIYSCPQVDALTVDGFDDPVMALLDVRLPDGGGGSACWNDTTYTGTGGFLIPQNAMALASSAPTCQGGVIVFSANRALSFMNTAGSLPWTDAAGDVYDVVRPPRRLRVPVTFWMHTTADKVALKSKISTEHFNRATTILTESMSGIVLVADEGSDAPPTVGDADAIGAGAAIGNGCSHVPTIKATSAIYDPNRINVYYVDDPGGAGDGYTCIKNGARNIIFIRRTAYDYTLMHELGHAMGLDRPSWGHTTNFKGFYADASAVPPVALDVMDPNASDPTYLSLGQVARMNLSDSSFLNISTGTGGTSVRSRQAAALGAMAVWACGCPEDAATTDCPALNKDIIRTPKLAEVGGPFACTVTVSDQTVACRATIPVTAYLKSGTSDAYSGSESWISLDPTTVTVTPITADVGWIKASIRGEKAGSAKVRVWAGGTYATMTVTVSGPCPAT